MVLAAVAIVGANARAAAAESVIDRTYVCTTAFVGGIRTVETRAHSGRRVGSEWKALPYAVISSGGVARTPGVDYPPENSLAWVSAGRPAADTLLDEGWLSFTARAGGTVGVSREVCAPTKILLQLSGKGLKGGAAGALGTGYDCEVPPRVLVRLRAVVGGGTALRERGRLFRATSAPARTARIGVGTLGGRVLAYGEVTDDGRARLYAARTCTAD